MANHRCFSKTIIDSDAFLDMPASTQALYFHLAMRADDDGFLNNPKKVQRMIGASEDDLKLLLAKRFILAFQSGVIVIKHWRIHNAIRKDRYKPTVYTEEMGLLTVKENGAYTERIPDGASLEPEWIPDGSSLEPQVKLSQVKLSQDKLSIESAARTRFTPPSVEQVRDYCQERQNGIDPQRFVDYYASRGWKIGRNPMKDWKAAVRTWEGRERDDRGGYSRNAQQGTGADSRFASVEYDF